jgi:hypothetical protein
VKDEAVATEKSINADTPTLLTSPARPESNLVQPSVSISCAILNGRAAATDDAHPPPDRHRSIVSLQQGAVSETVIMSEGPVERVRYDTAPRRTWKEVEEALVLYSTYTLALTSLTNKRL